MIGSSAKDAAVTNKVRAKALRYSSDTEAFRLAAPVVTILSGVIIVAPLAVRMSTMAKL